MIKQIIMKTGKLFQLIALFLLVPTLSFAQYQKVNSNGLDIYYRIFGEGDPILILGGGPGDVSDRYVSLCEVLLTKYKCILVEQRGSGKSAPEVYDSTTVSLDLTINDLEFIRKKLKLKRWAVLGFSYGGYLAAFYTQKYPASVSSLIHLNSMGLNASAFDHFLDNINSGLQASDLEVVNYWMDSTRLADNRQHAITEIIRARMPGYFYSREKSLLVTQTMKDTDFNFDIGKWIWKDVIDLTKLTPTYTNAVLVIAGRQDPLGEGVPISINNYYKSSKLIFIEKCGHYSWIERPDNVLSAIGEFLQNSTN